MHRRSIVLLAACALLAAGCLPSRIVIDLQPTDGKLQQTTVLADQGAAGASPKVAIIDVEGLIADAPEPRLIGAALSPVDALAARLRVAEKDPDIRAVIIRINSPGGTVTGSDIMYDEIRDFADRSGKPVVASMSEIAASGGYYVALAADEIYAHPTTVTGSIGVIFRTFNFAEGMARFGIDSRAVVSGPNKDIASPFDPMQDSHYALLQEMIDEYYDSFRTLVSDRRPSLRENAADEATDGRVLTGARAHEIGLVDHLGGIRDAFDAAKRLAGLNAAQLVKLHTPGRVPASPYALAPSTDASRTTQLNLLQLNLPEQSLEPGFYYLWAPNLVQ